MKKSKVREFAILGTKIAEFVSLLTALYLIIKSRPSEAIFFILLSFYFSNQYVVYEEK